MIKKEAQREVEEPSCKHIYFYVSGLFTGLESPMMAYSRQGHYCSKYEQDIKKTLWGPGHEAAYPPAFLKCLTHSI